jgi:hypothetical protein
MHGGSMPVIGCGIPDTYIINDQCVFACYRDLVTRRSRLFILSTNVLRLDIQ